MVESGWVRIGLRAATVVILGFLYLPLVIVLIHAFNESPFNEWPPTGLTLRWFGEALANSAIPPAFVNSVLAALGATAVALVLGTLAAMAVQRLSFFGRDSISFLLVLPIALPGVVTGIALSATYQTVGIPFGLLTIIIGYSDVLLESAADESQRSAVAEIRKASDRGAALTRQLLAFGRRHDPQVAQVDVSRTVDSLRDMLRRVIREDIALTFDTSAERSAVMVERLQHVLAHAREH